MDIGRDKKICPKYLVPLSLCERCRNDIDYRIEISEKRIERLEKIADPEERRLAASHRCLFCKKPKKINVAKRRITHYNT